MFTLYAFIHEQSCLALLASMKETEAFRLERFNFLIERRLEKTMKSVTLMSASYSRTCHSTRSFSHLLVGTRVLGRNSRKKAEKEKCQVCVERRSKIAYKFEGSLHKACVTRTLGFFERHLNSFPTGTRAHVASNKTVWQTDLTRFVSRNAKHERACKLATCTSTERRREKPRRRSRTSRIGVLLNR